MPTFQNWLTTRRATDNPRGDFIADARTDSRFPKQVADWDQLEGYLFYRGACREAMKAGKHLWRQYKRAVDAR